MEKIVLSKEKETLLIPLIGKAAENAKKNPLLADRKAAEIVSRIDYDFASLKVPGKTDIMMCIRARIMDDFVRDFLSRSAGSAVLHLGCGLDSRYFRIGSPPAAWYDVDYPEVIDLRRHFYEETESYHLVPSSVTAPGWLERLPDGGKPCVVVAEGLFMYLTEEEIRVLLQRIGARFPAYTLIFDAYSRLTARQAGRHPSLKKTGAKISWGVDDPGELTKWEAGIRFVGERYFTSYEGVRSLDLGTRILFGAAGLIPMARKAHRILIYEISRTD